MNQIIELSKKIKRTAIQLLAEKKIIESLSEFGTPLIIGSFELDLMIDKDIDIVVESKLMKVNAQLALNKFIDLEIAQKFEFGNFVKFPRANRPNGFILNLKMDFQEEPWEIEIWFLTDISSYRQQLSAFKSKLSEEKKIKILKRKHQRILERKTKHDLNSMKIYKEILK